MELKKVKPVTPGRRFQTYLSFEEITESKPYKNLTRAIAKSGGRNNVGRITSRHRGGGHKRRYRIIDFKRDKRDIPGKVEAIEYDPNRSARIARIIYRDGERRYILWPKDLKIGDTIAAGPKVDIRPGNALPLRNIPMGTNIHNVELKIGKGGQIVRSAGSFAQILAKEGSYAQVRLPSGEVRMVHLDCYSTVGQLGNEMHENVSLGKAGRKRWLGRRPYVRGVAMNPIDHPHGGGEGKTSGGRHPVTPWGVPTKGHRTRGKKQSDKYIVRPRSRS